MAGEEVIGWHHRFSEHECEQTLGDSEGQGTWRAAVHGVAKSKRHLATERQQRRPTKKV